jgi:DNA-binding transcriptional LysR family regulator
MLASLLVFGKSILRIEFHSPHGYLTVRFKRFDLNLLVVLEALLKEHNVSHAARKLNMSQPALSTALGRLRAYFNDPILVQHGRRMVPTAHAQGLCPLVVKALADLEALLSTSTVFDPAVSQRTFRICASDYLTTVLLAPLLEDLARSAPHVRVVISAPSPEGITRLERGEIEFLVSPEQYMSKDHPKKLLFAEAHVVVGWKRNPVFRAPLTQEVFFKQPHVAIVLSHTQVFAEREMGTLAHKRRVEVTASSFLAVPSLLPNTRRLALMPERLARIMSKRLPLATAPLPFQLPLMREMVQYHAVRESDGGMQWFLQRMREHAARIGAGQGSFAQRGAR